MDRISWLTLAVFLAALVAINQTPLGHAFILKLMGY